MVKNAFPHQMATRSGHTPFSCTAIYLFGTVMVGWPSPCVVLTMLKWLPSPFVVDRTQMRTGSCARRTDQWLSVVHWGGAPKSQVHHFHPKHGNFGVSCNSDTNRPGLSSRFWRELGCAPASAHELVCMFQERGNCWHSWTLKELLKWKSWKRHFFL